jgi:Domain of unknown function (DUF4259)
MGAWGTGIFENDSALDFLEDFLEISNLKTYFFETLKSTIETDYLDADQGCEVLVISALIDVLKNGTVYEELTEDYPQIIEQIQSLSLNSIKPLVLEALPIVISEHSELNELWEESEEDYPQFKSEVLNLIERIQ